MKNKLREFLYTESAGGAVMITAALVALLLANSPVSDWYFSLVNKTPLGWWVKDILMVFFFLLVGMELKREMLEGILSERRQQLLPLLAAAGGMAVPALIFTAINLHQPELLHGWAIPCATDIAFAVCVLTLLAGNIPQSAKIFLLAIAIFDDLGAILIIAIFYNTQLALLPLLLALAGIAALILLNRFLVTAFVPYLAVGIFLWFCLHAGGIHTTIAGVAVGCAIPLKSKSKTPLSDAIKFLHPCISFLVMPLFAFTQAGVLLGHLHVGDLLNPLPLGIALGLFFGKQLGIFGTVFLLSALGLIRKPKTLSWMHLYGVSVIAGIGFTMSLFVSLLAFTKPELVEAAKLGIIGGSLLSVIWGAVVLRSTNE